MATDETSNNAEDRDKLQEAIDAAKELQDRLRGGKDTATVQMVYGVVSNDVLEIVVQALEELIERDAEMVERVSELESEGGEAAEVLKEFEPKIREVAVNLPHLKDYIERVGRFVAQMHDMLDPKNPWKGESAEILEASKNVLIWLTSTEKIDAEPAEDEEKENKNGSS
jgi:hypothetical protein